MHELNYGLSSVCVGVFINIILGVCTVLICVYVFLLLRRINVVLFYNEFSKLMVVLCD